MERPNEHDFEAIFDLPIDNRIFASFLDHLPFPVQLYTADGTMIFANESFFQEFEIDDPSKILGQYNLLKDPNVADDGLLETVRRALSGETVFTPDVKVPVQAIKRVHKLETRYIEQIVQDILTYPVKDAEGNILFLANILTIKGRYRERSDITKAVEYIESHWKEEFSAQETAREVSMSYAYFFRLFKKHVGMTPHDYYISIKMNKLKEFLMDANLSVEEAFSACGINYHGYYAGLFREKSGMTPSEYRRRFLHSDRRNGNPKEKTVL
ncbi:helix-turn-helix transcriptional regulator [Papillibacter cinnamivorans]|uniref:Helix-turn-helix domain-containing protein n=1 Tax=Papillibacter cinnamivorans DSM 12816 TaxID=1122930 RepID=A0A1W1YDG3_9FIRM|nr:helix-turn-helix domain-containing protein [Papillibacter cinnamivorans]SMC34186.1 Helix-turn-helix domain-containing protein [Papillibacter cinnamivorans DSM 12816]